MSRIIKFLILFFFINISLPPILEIFQINEGQTISAEFCGPRHKHKKVKKDGRRKSVHVRGYTTKKGKHVKSYWKRPPKRH